MSKKLVIETTNAPKAIGTYSQAIMVNETLYISGQIGINPGTNTLVETFNEQLHQIFKNIESILKTKDLTFENLVKLTIYVISMDYFVDINAIMMEYFKTPFPARAVLGVSELPKNALVEVESIAVANL